MKRGLNQAAAMLAFLLAAALCPAAATEFDDAVAEVLALPYNPAAQPIGLDVAFGANDYPAAFPLTDLAGGACCTSPVPDQPPLADLAPPFAEFPEAFELIELEAYDGTPLHAFAALHPGAPGIVVMHGFNTNGKYSIVRYAAFLYANGYSVIAPDHRDMGREWVRGGSWHPDGTRHGQTLGWKESRDLLVAAEWLDANGVSEIGVLGFSEGAQNTILALGIDHHRIIDTALTFSPPADQKTLAQRSPQTTSALLTTVVNNPDLCGYLASVGARPEFSATANFILDNDSAVDMLDGLLGSGITAPGLHFHANDDTLVPPWNATLLASRTNQMDNQHTVLLTAGNHAYFYDRYWTQLAALTWFSAWLDPDGSHTTRLPTVTQTPGGTPAGEQQIDLSTVTRSQGDAERFTGDLCPEPTDPVAPKAILEVSGSGHSRTLDGRRSYTGWEGHQLVSWAIDPGDGSPTIEGSDIADAVIEHGFAPGTHTVMLTVTDDTGQQNSAFRMVQIEGPEVGVAVSGRVLGAGKWDRGSDDKHDMISFSFDARVTSKGTLTGRLKVKDKDLDVKIDAREIVALGTGTDESCGGVILDGNDTFAFVAHGTLSLGTEEQAAAIYACGIDNGKQGGGNGAHSPDYFHVEVMGGDYSTGSRTLDNDIDGGNIHLKKPIIESSGFASKQQVTADDEGPQQVLTLEPGLITQAVAGAPLVLAATLEGGDQDGAPVELRWVTEDGATESAQAVTSATGVALFAITMPQGEVAFTAWAGDLDSNPVSVKGH